MLAKWHLTARDGVTVSLSNSGDTGVLMDVTLDQSKYTPADLPPKQDWVTDYDNIARDSGIFDGIAGLLDIFNIPIFLSVQPQASILARGIFIDRYQAPEAPLNDTTPSVSFADNLDATVQAAQTIDDSQPFPVSGRINVGWFRCNPGGPYIAECTEPTTTVVLDGSRSSDPDSNPLTLDWTGGFIGGSASGQTASVQFLPNLGTFPVTLTAADTEVSTTCNTTVVIAVSPGSIENDIRQFLAAGQIKNSGLANSFLSQVAAAANAQCTTASKIYRAFINELQAQSGKGVGAAAATQMIGATECLMAQTQCG